MKLKHLLLFPDAAEGGTPVGAGAAALGATPAPAPTPSTPPAGTPSATPGGAAPTPTPTPTVVPQAPAMLSAQQVADLVQQTVRAAQPAAAPKEFSQEDFDKTFNVYKPSAQDVTDMLAGGEGAIAALNRIQAGFMKQAMTMAALHSQSLLEQFEREKLGGLSEVQKDYLERQTEKVKGQFFTAFPHLKQHETLVVAVGTQLQQSGFKGTPAEAFQAVATQVEAILKTAGVQPTGVAGQGQAQQPAAGAQPSHQMASLGVPGGGGGLPVGAAPSASKKSAGLSALD